jgi:hypothetical protein
MPAKWPFPIPPAVFFLLLPLEEQETSYLAESDSIFSFSINSTQSPEHMFGNILSFYAMEIKFF